MGQLKIIAPFLCCVKGCFSLKTNPPRNIWKAIRCHSFDKARSLPTIQMWMSWQWMIGAKKRNGRRMTKETKNVCPRFLSQVGLISVKRLRIGRISLTGIFLLLTNPYFGNKPNNEPSRVDPPKEVAYFDTTESVDTRLYSYRIYSRRLVVIDRIG